jgi:Ribonuclease P/MRP, subunit p29
MPSDKLIRYFLLTVRQSKNPCLVGLSGIVAYETENAFEVVTRNAEIKCSCTCTVTSSNETVDTLCRIQCFQNSIPYLPSQCHYFLHFCLPHSHRLCQHQRSIRTLLSCEPRRKKEIVQDRPHIEFELYDK